MAFGDKIDHKARQTGAVIIFQPGVTVEQARAALQKLNDVLTDVNVQTFNPTYGTPEFYVA